ncbi:MULTISPECIES: four helix bundle protein [Duncaniella]|jgi:four helix bundle protein|uniref:four helix bundle protein n=1 Tax=Duncaniella TaxID=2518495 RepID=UPI0025B6BA9D|nr:four helix bundle protein [Duncaniella muris]
MRKRSIAYDKAKSFAVRIIKFKVWLCEECHEYSLADQVLRSGTSIGANLAESFDAVSLSDFKNKLSIALKECSETKYWLEIIYDSGLISEDMYRSL